MRKLCATLFCCLGAAVLSAAPGNVFVEGETVALALPAGATDIRVTDVDGKACSFDPAAGGSVLRLGKLPAGFYRIEYRDGAGRPAVDGAAVLIRPVETLNPASPIAVDAALFYPFYLRRIGSMKFDYTPGDVAGLLRKANLGCVRERIMWEAFDYLDPKHSDRLVDELTAAYAEHGIEIVQSLYGTPEQDRYPAALSALGAKKPPLDLTKIHDYAKAVTARFGKNMPALESWNEPEGIGGSLLSFEIAAVQKAAALGALRANPAVITFMGSGTPEHPAALAENRFNDYQNVFCFHSHSRLEDTAARAAKLAAAADGLPVWLTEVSTGSFPTDPETGEFAPEAARQQALDIPKVCAALLAEGADRLFYFFLFNHTEVSGMSFGLLRHRDLSPRPGFVTLAVLANYFQNFGGIRQLEELPAGVTGYEATILLDGTPHRVRLLWSDSGKPVAVETAQAQYARDAFGRPVDIGGGKIVLTDMPVYLFRTAAGIEFVPMPVPEPLKAPSRVVLNLELPDGIKNSAADTFMLPVGEERNYPLAVCNFSDAPLSGKISVEFPNGEADSFELAGIELPADSRVVLPLRLRLDRLSGTAAPSRLVIRGNFGGEGESVLVANFTPVRTRLLPGDAETPVPGWEKAGNWRKYLIKGSEMEISAGDGDIRFDYRFQEAENRVVGHVWASPTMSLDVRDFPEYVPDAFAFELRLLEGEGLETLGLNLVEADGATYFATLPFKTEELRRGQTFIVPLSSMVNPNFRKKDMNGKLDLEKLTSFELPLWAKPGSRLRFAVSNPRWVNYKETKMKKLMSSLVAATALTAANAAGPARTVPVANADFAQAKADGTPEKWGISANSDPNFSAKIEDGALKLEAKSRTKWYSVYLAPADVKALPAPKEGEVCRIEFSYRQKNEGLKGHAFGTVEIRTGDHKRLAHKDGIDLAPDADWTERKLVLDLAEIPADGKYILLSFFLGDATGTARFDDVKLTVRTVKK